jgi:glucose-fructose oxidoreductase
MKRWKIAGINFDHFHMGDLLRMAFNHADAEIVGISDEKPERMLEAASNFGLSSDKIFTDFRACLENSQPDLVILCPATAKHGEWTEKVAPFNVNILMEKPFASTLSEADRMIAAMALTRKQLAINWPLAWVPAHRTAKRLIDQGTIGEVIEVHYYDGNRGPLYHSADKKENTPEDIARAKPDSWFYKKSHGGGSLLDYLGYGTTLGTWFHGGEAPLDVTAVVDQPAGLEVDEHSITVARYRRGLSKFETRWGTFTDPWTLQPQPRCGFVIVGSEGTISSYDYETTIRMQTRNCPEGEMKPIDEFAPPLQNPIQYVLDCIEKQRKIEGPLSIEISRTGQRIVDAAARSAAERRTVSL